MRSTVHHVPVAMAFLAGTLVTPASFSDAGVYREGASLAGAFDDDGLFNVDGAFDADHGLGDALAGAFDGAGVSLYGFGKAVHGLSEGDADAFAAALDGGSVLADGFLESAGGAVHGEPEAEGGDDASEDERDAEYDGGRQYLVFHARHPSGVDATR